VALLLPLAAGLRAESAPRLQLIDRDPGHGVTLRPGEPLYLRVRYRSAMPIRILVNGQYRGEVVLGFRQDGEELFPAGAGEATVWLAYPRAVTIDEVRLRVLNANWARVAVADFPMAASWTGAAGSRADAATKPWVADLTPGQRQRLAEASEPVEASGGLDSLQLMFLCVPGYLLLQAGLAFWTSGGWRKATLAPAVIMVPILAYTVLALAGGSNLWPLLMLFTAPLAFLYLVVLGVSLVLWRLARAA
jgi:hypothetical protein